MSDEEISMSYGEQDRNKIADSKYFSPIITESMASNAVTNSKMGDNAITSRDCGWQH